MARGFLGGWVGGRERLGVNADTGGSISNDGIEGKFLGFGLSVGKQTGISAPVGEVKFKTDDCTIQ